MQIIPTTIPDCYEIKLNPFRDARGVFVKTFHREIFQDHQLETHFQEAYYSCSTRDVLRGLHFQIPPKDHTKLVHCAQGAVIDVVVDLRVGSPAYGEFVTFELNAENANLAYVPPGLAHGFFIVSETALVMYQVSTVYSPQHEQGIRWDSIGYQWPSDQPLVSDKDQQWQTLADFKSPFVYPATQGVRL
jgi:dTDP-4-dehydrorhamnose 3,5-epimerase